MMVFSNEASLGSVLEVYSERFALSPREREVLTLAVLGIHDKGIADQLGCSRHTVGTHWKRIFRKTGSRPQREVFAQLVRVLVEHSYKPQRI